jgi:hypothetical protein
LPDLSDDNNNNCGNDDDNGDDNNNNNNTDDWMLFYSFDCLNYKPRSIIMMITMITMIQ